MKKTLQIVFSLLFTAFLCISVQAQRYTTEIFPSVTVTNDVIYANNFQVLTGSPVATDLKMDVYEPGTPDPLSKRPLVIIMHTGSFLPPTINGQPTGSRKDSTIVAACTKFAKRGYVAVGMSYRLGWNPAATGTAGQDIRTGTLLQAVYRAILDAKACVRYFYKDAATTNQFKVDTNHIILGGFGTGGYISMAYVTLDKTAEINLPKFLAATTNLSYGFTAGQSYVNQSLLGDFNGYGGNAALNNPNNSVGYSTKVHFAFNAGGALGDKSWMEPGDAPMVCFHVAGDPFAPFADGPVIVPTTGDFVVDVSGSQSIIFRADSLGNNNCFSTAAASFTDPYTLRANAINGGLEGLFPFITNPAQQAGPWEWYDSTVTVAVAVASGLSAAQGTAAYTSALLTNPNMSKAKALAYIDTIMGYLNPRVVACLNLSTGLPTVTLTAQDASVYPNPAAQFVQVTMPANVEPMRKITMTDISGRVIYSMTGLNTYNQKISCEGLQSGMYLIQIESSNRNQVLKLIVQ